MGLLFKRREKLSWKKRLSGYLWPQGGWKRYGQFILLKLHRLGGTPRSIAAGFACGAAISFTPFVGFHMILAAATAFLLRGNIIASAVGTVVGNPWTFPFIWISVLYTGRLMLGETGAGKIEFAHVFEKSFHALMTLDFSSFGKRRLAGAQADDCRLRAVLCSGLVRVLLSGKEGFWTRFRNTVGKTGLDCEGRR